MRFAVNASGATTPRPGLKLALAAAEARLIDVLFVHRPTGSPATSATPSPSVTNPTGRG